MMYCGYIMLYNDIYIYMHINAYVYYISYIEYVYIYMGVVLNSFTRKRLLGRPWANLVRNYLARPQSRVSFWLRMFSCLIFRARFRALFRVASYSYSVYTNVCLLVLASSYQKIYLLLFTNYIHIVYPCACLCF